jgi:hypothetical protein
VLYVSMTCTSGGAPNVNRHCPNLADGWAPPIGSYLNVPTTEATTSAPLASSSISFSEPPPPLPHSSASSGNGKHLHFQMALATSSQAPLAILPQQALPPPDGRINMKSRSYYTLPQVNHAQAVAKRLPMLLGG